MKQNPVYGLLGLAQRAGKVASGEFMTETSVKEGKSYLVLVASDASERTKKQFKNMSDYNKVPYREYGLKDEIRHSIGKEFRASLSVIDEGLAKQIMSKIDGGSN